MGSGSADRQGRTGGQTQADGQADDVWIHLPSFFRFFSFYFLLPFAFSVSLLPSHFFQHLFLVPTSFFLFLLFLSIFIRTLLFLPAYLFDFFAWAFFSCRLLCSALRVPPAETRLTVYRRLHIINRWVVELATFLFFLYFQTFSKSHF